MTDSFIDWLIGLGRRAPRSEDGRRPKPRERPARRSAEVAGPASGRREADKTLGPSRSRATRTRPVVQRRFGAARLSFVDLPEARSGGEGGHGQLRRTQPPLRGSGSRRPPAAAPGAVVGRTADGRARRGPGTYATPCPLLSVSSRGRIVCRLFLRLVVHKICIYMRGSEGRVHHRHGKTFSERNNR